MTMIMLTTIILMMIIYTLLLISMMISKKTFMDREKMSPFECGFDPKSSPRLPFSLHFFLISIIFLIFDIEITLLMPMIFIFNKISIMTFSIYSNMFFIILIMGTYHEWNQGALNWQL